MAVGRPQRRDALLGAGAAGQMSYRHPIPPPPNAGSSKLSPFPVGDNCVGVLDSLSSPRFLIALVKQMSGCEGGKDCPLPCLIYMKAVEVSV